MNIEERFLAKVDKTTGCWLWTAQVKPDGYGHFSVRGSSVRAHRFAYEWFVGPIPEGLQLDHLCRVRHCVNPKHLEPVTAQENVRRGLAPAAFNVHKTHCPAGHAYDEANTYRARGERHCRTCRRDEARARRQRANNSGAALERDATLTTRSS